MNRFIFGVKIIENLLAHYPSCGKIKNMIKAEGERSETRDSEQLYNNHNYNEALDARLKRLSQLSKTSIESALNKLPDRAKILDGIDLKTATDEEIDAAYDRALAESLEERRALFPPASPRDLRRRTDR